MSDMLPAIDMQLPSSLLRSYAGQAAPSYVLTSINMEFSTCDI